MCTVTQPRLPLGGTFPAHRVFDITVDAGTPNPRGNYEDDPLFHALTAQGVPPGIGANIHWLRESRPDLEKLLVLVKYDECGDRYHTIIGWRNDGNPIPSYNDEWRDIYA